MTARLVITIVLAAAACKQAPPASSETPAAPLDAAPAVTRVATDAAPAPDCSEHLGPVRSGVTSTYVAKETQRPFENALEAWPAVPEACRDGEWYILAAKLLGARPSTRLEATGVVLERREQALAEAVTRRLDARALAYVALVAGVGGTRLPGDACAAVESEDSDDARYVCGHAALAAGDAKAAKARFEAIEVPGLYADLDLRRAQAELALGNRAAARKLAKRAAALPQRDARFRYASLEDWKAIVAAAKAIAK